LEFHVPMDEAYSRDGLTGLLSRPVIEQIVRQNINLLRRLKQPCAVALIDIDHFKQVNDRYGHAAGDNYLKAVGEALKRTVRNTDVVGRWGGEEFMVFMPGTDRRGASATVTKLLQALRQLQVEHQGSRIRATASAGIWVGHPRMPFEKVYESADAALYRAKEQGRDRFSFAMELVSSERSGPVPDAPVEQQGGSPS
ncbi:MAG TPA: GGDEF domain-containing protein, partial [Solimonas sp.]|nr:GGDEF domain-containing protein [Solimonas sp.]